ncbi:MAG: hypothetical protein ACFFC7_22335 [Candidatus Hermodarchaeota archaeon]
MSEDFQVSIEDLEKKLRDATQLINESDQQNKQLNEELDALRNQINNLKSVNAEKDEQLSTLTKLYQEKTNEVQTKDGTIFQLEMKINDLESKITASTQKVQEFEQQIRAFDIEKAELKQNIMQVTEGKGEEVASLRTELGKVQAQFEEKQIELVQTKNTLAQIQKELEETGTSLTQTQAELSQKKDELESKITELEESQNKVNILENRIKEYLLSVKKLVLEGALDNYPIIRKDLMSHAKEVKVLELLMSNDLILSEQEVYEKIPDVSQEAVKDFIDQLKEEELIVELNGYLALHKLLEDINISEEDYKRADLGRVFNWAIIEAVSATSTEDRQGALLKLHKILEERVQSPILFEMLVFTTKDLPDPNETVNALKNWKKRILESSLRR